jgi:MFS family permease
VRRTVYYGWANLFIAAAGMVATLPGRTQGLGLITEPLLADLEIDRVSYATINLWATVIGALFCLPVGRLTDRFGARAVLATLLAGLGVTVLAMARAWDMTGVSITVTLTRGLGQSALSVVSLALVGKWFARRLNHAMAVFSVLVGFGFIAAFPTVGRAVQVAGWRTAWFGVGVTLIALAPLAAVFVRNRPDTSEVVADDVEELRSQPTDLSLLDALRSVAFWSFALSSAMFGLVYSGIALFNQSILEERGFDASTYVSALVISTMLGLVANFAGGWLATRWPIQRLMGLGMAVLAGALLALPHVQTYVEVAAYAAAMGISGGIVTVVFFSVWGQVFGRAHLGRIQGAAQMMTVFASAVGPLLLADTLRDTGSYDVMFNGLAVVVIALGIISWRVPLPRRRQAERGSAPDGGAGSLETA